MTANLPSSLLPFILHFLKPHRWAITALVGFSVLSGLYALVNAYLTKVLIDYVASSAHLEVDLLHALFWPALFFVINFEVHNLSWRGIQYIKLKAGPVIQNQIISDMFSRTEKNAFRFFQDNFAGTIASNIKTLGESVFDILNNLCPLVIRQVTQVIATLISMYFANPLFSVVFAIWVVVFMAISLLFSPRMSALSDSLAESSARLSGKITDSISNVNNVRLFARENFEVRYLRQYLNDVRDKIRRQEWFNIKLSIAQSLSITLLVAVLLYGLLTLRMRNLVTAGDFAFILGLALYVAEGTWWLTEQLYRIVDLSGRSKQSLHMLLVPQEITDNPTATPLVMTKGEIVFDKVVFQYKGQDNLFENKSVTIPGGQKVGLVGYSGSGKTTFVNLIVRLFDVTSGAISIDGQNIREVTQQSLRDNIGFITQDPILFHRTLMENIRYGKIDASDEEVIAAAKKAHAHEFIMETVDGYQSLVGERGIKLSGGQRQRISIARAILKNSPILILDEATSAFDSVTERYIQDSLTHLMQGKTVIVIAHRLSTLLEMDRILVFDQGEIVEDGTHHTLIHKKEMYAHLWNSQVGGFLLDDKE